MRVKLTPAFCKTASAEPGKERSVYWDSTLPGFGLVVTSNGAKSYALQYRNGGGNSRRLTFDAGALSLDAARREARKYLGDIARGGDPLGDRRRERAAANAAQAGSLEAVAQEYLRREGKKLRSIDERRAVFERTILPKLGKYPIANITRADITRLLDHVEDTRGPVAATKALAFLGKLFCWHATRTDDFRTPIVPGMARSSAKERARSRILSDDELRRVWAATAKPAPFHSLVRFLLLTASRRSEAACATWNEIDSNNVWTIGAGRNKSKTDVALPLSRAATEGLEAVLAIGQKKDGPIFSLDGVKPINGFAKQKRRLDQASGVIAWRLHDLRRTARSLLSRAGIPSDIAERCLGHAIGGIVQRTYDRHPFLEEKRAAFEALAREIAAIIRGDSIPMRKVGRRGAGPTAGKSTAR
jgi:integrase